MPYVLLRYFVGFANDKRIYLNTASIRYYLFLQFFNPHLVCLLEGHY